MNARHTLALLLALAFFPSDASASNQADDLWILAAGRGPGIGGSMWMTDLHVMNVSEEAVEVDVTFLPRSGALPMARSFELLPSQTLTLTDVVGTTFDQQSAFGALRIEVVQDVNQQDVGQDEARLVAHARIYDQGQSGTVGQSLEGLSSASAISADGPEVTHVVGVTNNNAYRSNWFGVNIGEPDDEEESAEVLVEVLSSTGTPTGSKKYLLASLEPAFFSVSEIAPSVGNATLRFTMLSGKALFGVSKIDMVTNDPTTLETHSRGTDESDRQFTDEFLIDECTFTPNGKNPFFPLTPGVQLVFEGEDDGEVVENTIDVLSETVVIDGVTTRVVTETELRDDELVEKSRNYYSECVATGDVFYFGEDVDIYEDGQIVSHDGAWRAGVNGARAGIIMPGKPLAGSRYYQELAPGIALDRAEHVKSGVEFQTPAGTFDDCLSVRETSPLDSGISSFKVYCAGVGLVFDSGAELTEQTEP